MRPQPYTKTYNQLRNAESGRKSFPQRRVYELDIQHQMVISENKHTSDIRQTEHISFRENVYTYAYMQVTTIKEKWGHEFERDQKGYMGEFEGKKWKGNDVIILESQK